MTWCSPTSPGLRRAECLSTLPLLLSLLVWPAILACDTGRSSPGLWDAVSRGEYQVTDASKPGFALTNEPELTEITVDHERRPAVLLEPGVWTWRGEVPIGAWLQAGAQLVPEAWDHIDELEVRVTARYGSTRELLDLARVESGETPRWLDLGTSLSHLAGREVTLEFSAQGVGRDLPSLGQEGLVAWAPVSLRGSGAGRPEDRPNVLVILVDTLRFDRLSAYGYGRSTTPELQRLVAERGVVVEEAYSQAPWTLPSMVSLMTGRYPGELIPPDLGAFRIDQEVESLAEAMDRLGYDTAAFYGNPALQEWNGFGRGFATFYSPPEVLASMRLHAEEELQGRVLNWLRAHQHRPFFLYVHYIDPHDPYESPDVPDGRSQFDPDYSGTLLGSQVHGVYTGRVPLLDPQADVSYLGGLYDHEVAFVDRQIGRLIESLDPEVLRRTLIVVTADHGEELYDHGGWKHGESLYDEQVRVPLLMRWDGHITPGSRLPGTVRLVDLMPTLVAVVGGEVAQPVSGLNLLPAILGETSSPRRPAFAQHLSWGPLRAAAILGGTKLILFNRHTPFAPDDAAKGYLWRNDLKRMERVEVYDLKRDPDEKRNLAQERPDLVAALAPVIHRRLIDHLPGIRVVASGVPSGSLLRARVLFDQPPGRADPYFLAAGDRQELQGRKLLLELAGEPLTKGVLVSGDELSGVEAIEVWLDGDPLPCRFVHLGSTTACSSEAWPRDRLAMVGWPPDPSDPTLRVFWPQKTTPGSASESEAEMTREHLETLGYLSP